MALSLPSLRTRTVLRLMLLTGVRHAWTAARFLISVTLLAGILLSSFCLLFLLNLWSFHVLEAVWDLHAAGTAIPHRLLLQTVGILSGGTVALVVFWFFVWRNRHEPEVQGALVEDWVRGLPLMHVTYRSPRRDKMIVWLFTGFYLANGLALLASVMVLIAGIAVLLLAQAVLSPLVKAWDALSAPLPSGVNVPVGQRVTIRLTQLWNRHSQRMLDAHPDAFVKVEQQVLRDSIPDPLPGTASRPRARL